MAAGGMAEVFRAVCLGGSGVARPVAVKRILPHLTRDPTVVAMLVEEARIALSLNHRNVVRVVDLGQEEGSYFIVMELIEGQPLSALMTRAQERGQRIPLQLGFHVVQELLEALRYVHGLKNEEGQPLNLIHRDISPQNIMVTYDGAVLVVDFGIAKAADRAGLTQAGTLKGKPGYMSPEVVKGLPITQRLDLYALGVVMHELITLMPLREPGSPLQMLADVRRGSFKRFADLGLVVPPDAEDLIYRALAPDPSDRWESAAAMADRLTDVRRKEGWNWSASDVAAWLRPLFAEELRREEVSRVMAHSLTLGVDAPPPEASTVPAAAPWPRKKLGVTTLVAASTVLVTVLAATASRQDVPTAPSVVVAAAATATPPVITVPDVAPRRRQVRRPLSGMLTLQSRPWSRVFLDGRDTGLYTPVVDLPVVSGPHRVKLVNDVVDMRSEFTVNVAAGARVKEARRLR